MRTSTVTTEETAASPTRQAIPVLLLAVEPSDLRHYEISSFTLIAAHHTADALDGLGLARPRAVVIDWDCATLDPLEISRAASRHSGTRILVATAQSGAVPTALKAGCHGVIFKPFTRVLVAGRLGRLLREIEPANPMGRAPLHDWWGTNRRWAKTCCPTCQEPGATSFEFASHRRMWYACLACDHVWLGRRQE